MSRVSIFSAPFVLGFDSFEERFDRLAKSAESYPPYNIERRLDDAEGERYLISIAVAGFSRDDLEIVLEDQQLLVRGGINADPEREYLHRGIATRQFQRTFLLAQGMQVEGADLKDGLLIISVIRPTVEKTARHIEIALKS